MRFVEPTAVSDKSKPGGKKTLLSPPIRDSVEVGNNYCESHDGGKRNLYGLAEGYLRTAC
jgi:hypothetical protein